MQHGQPYTKDRHSALSDLIKLDETEKKYLSDLKKIIHSDSVADQETLLTAFKNFHLGIIFKLAENNKEINQFCDTNDMLNTQWSDYLAQLRYPKTQIDSMDKKIQFSLFTQLKGAFLLHKLKGFQNNSISGSAILNKACDFGMYQALVKRLTTLTDTIKDNSSQDKNIESVIQLAKKDAVLLSNLYWSAGLLNAASIYLALANYYCHPEDGQLSSECIHAVKSALDSFYKAKFLSDFYPSKLLINILYAEKGIFTGSLFKNWEETEKHFIKFTKEMGIPSSDDFCKKAREEAEQDVEKIKLMHSH